MDKELPYDLTRDERAAFKELKRKIHTDYGTEVADDFRIYRFLKARDFNIKHAENMLRENIQWRQKEKVDTILKNYKAPEVLEKYFPLYVYGFDTDGAPILVFELGNMDAKGLSKCIPKETISQHVTRCLQLAEHFMEENSRKLKKTIDKWHFIADCENLSALKVANKQYVDFMMTLSTLYEKHYPERLKHAYAINASYAFTLIYNVCKPLMAPVTLEKMKIFGKDGWQEEFKKFMGPNLSNLYLNRHLRDTYENDSPLTTISHGGVIPEKYYCKNSTERLKFKPDVSEHTLKNKGTLKVPVNVTMPSSILEWEFEIENNDIGFGLSYQDCNKTTTKVLIPLQRVHTEYCSSSGQYLCEEAGVYILIFDNAYSWMRQKHLYYIYSVTPLQNNAKQ